MAPSVSEVSHDVANGKVAPTPKVVDTPVNSSSADAIRLDNEHGAHK